MRGRPAGTGPTTRSDGSVGRRAGRTPTDYFERCAASVPALLQAAQQGASYEGPLSTDPEVLEKITAPFLLLRGQETELNTFYTETERYVAEHVLDPHIGLPLPGLGHLGPFLAPKPIAHELVSFFESVPQSS